MAQSTCRLQSGTAPLHICHLSSKSDLHVTIIPNSLEWIFLYSNNAFIYIYMNALLEYKKIHSIWEIYFCPLHNLISRLKMIIALLCSNFGGNIENRLRIVLLFCFHSYLYFSVLSEWERGREREIHVLQVVIRERLCEIKEEQNILNQMTFFNWNI
jgi:hypothetical protein